MNSYTEKVEAKKDYYQAKANELKAESSELWRNSYNWDKAAKLTKAAEYYQNKANAVGTGGISSYDPEAAEKITKKLETLKAAQERMKAANKAVRIKDTEKGNEALKALGYSEEGIAELRKPDFCGRVGYPAYYLSNNNQEIHRLEKRLLSLKASERREEFTEDLETENFTYRVDDGRCQFIFTGKPVEEVRNVLKSHAFKWSPSRSAWVRQNSENGARAAREVIRELKAIFND
jgi:hypothetical protein